MASYKISAVFFIVVTTISYCLASSKVTPDLKSTEGAVYVRATTNSSVPGLDYIIAAVECLKQAFQVYGDETNVAKLYAEMYSMKYPDVTWNVAIGYSTIYVQSKYYVETSVSSGGLVKSKKDDKKKDVLYLIFSSEKKTDSQPTPVNPTEPQTTQRIFPQSSAKEPIPVSSAKPQTTQDIYPPSSTAQDNPTTGQYFNGTDFEKYF